ncbi:lamin tail domain-containing protein [Candidatus Poribacteria bacterium]|nr:lamin tail domain-containing protein [Candidatus Poribacteria bacterium]
MMSMKWTFSFLTLMVAGLLIVAPTALANKIKLRVHDANHAADGDPADVSSADGIQVLAGTAGSIRLDAEEPLVVPADADVPGLFTVIGGAIGASAPTVSEGNKRLVITITATSTDADSEVTIYLLPKKLQSATTGDTDSTGAMLKFKYVAPDQNSASIMTRPIMMELLDPASGFKAAKVSGPFDVKITLSETPKEFKAGNIGIQNGSVGALVDGGTMDEPADDTDTASGRGDVYHTYKVTITPDFKKDKVIVWVKDFEDQALNPTNKYEVGRTSAGAVRKVPDDLANGSEKLEVSVDLTNVDKPTAAAGTSVGIANDTIIPMDGYLVVAKDDGSGANDAEKSSSTGIMHPGDAKDANLAGSGRSARAQKYNVVVGGLRDLENFLVNDGTIDLITTDGTGAVISEIMWGTDASLADPDHNQWIEIRNTSGAQIKTKDYKLMFYEANEALPDMMAADSKIADRVSTRNWNIAGTGQSGRSMAAIGGADVQFAAAIDIVSMQRVIDAAGMAADGTMASSWASSQRPSQNFKSDVQGRVGSPGAMPINYPAPPAPAPEPVVTPPTPVADAMDIKITEIMVDTGSGRLPQWIELTNVSGAAKSLAGWSVEIENDAADTDAIATSISINLSGTLGVGGGEGAGGTMGKSLLLVAGSARSSSNLADSDRVVDVSAAVEQKGRYTLLSPIGFLITLLPPQTTGIVQYGDMAGNLDAASAWDIPMDDSGRSSLIRREMLADGMATMGTDANGWVLASDTPLVSGPATWYGSDEDAGTPGYDSGGPLPVELSHFRPARDKATGAVVITWATQSELNNAGFFIKRSQQRDGQFQVINATMIAGAGTTSEKQTYTFTDTTAQPNIVYYYQIEDVSLDGNRQTLTRGIRLKGHIGAAGKLTSTWGELKSSNE